jgi:hypothetical protein
MPVYETAIDEHGRTMMTSGRQTLTNSSGCAGRGKARTAVGALQCCASFSAADTTLVQVDHGASINTHWDLNYYATDRKHNDLIRNVSLSWENQPLDKIVENCNMLLAATGVPVRVVRNDGK